MPVLRRDGATLNYEVWGESGPWVSMISGHTRPLNDYRMLGRHVVAQGWRVLALDNRGAGKTETARAFTFADMVADVAALWDELVVARSVVLGISMGGFIAQTLAAQAEARVAGLVLVSTAADQSRIVRDERPWTADLAEVGAKLAPYFTDDFARRNDVLVRSMIKQIAKNVSEGAFAAQSERQRQAVAGFTGLPPGKTLKQPAWIIHGQDDRIIPYDAALELAQALPQADLFTLPGAGHLLLAEKPQDLYRLVSEFLAALPEAPGLP